MELTMNPMIPVYDGGKASPILYNAGGMLADDSAMQMTAEDCPMQLVTETSEAEFAAYTKKLAEAGFVTLFENHTEAYDAIEAEKDGVRLYAYLTRLNGEVRIIEERCGVSVPAFSYAAEGCGSEIVQYGLYYDPKNDCTPTTVNCGMFYIVHLADNSLFVMDGGHRYQCSAEAVAGMADFMHKLTGTAADEDVRIAGWYFTHAHGDHMAACARLLHAYPGIFKIERLFMNFPAYGPRMRGYDPDVFVLKETLREYCADVPCLKLHTGMTFTLANVRFDVLYTHEDAVGGEDTYYRFRDFNCTSTILKMTVDGGSVMWLGDTNNEAERLLGQTTPASMWKADVVQVAHHCFNYLRTLYAWIDADYALMPNSYFGSHTPENTPKLADVEAHLADPANLWYAEKTIGIRFADGKCTVVREEDRIGGEHDGVDLYGVQH